MSGDGLRTRLVATLRRVPGVGGAHRLRRVLPVDARDRPWLALAVLPGCVAVAVYLATNPYPAYGAGLYATAAGEILANGYVPPVRVPGYTAEGVPFAYPPLGLYLLAVLLDLGGDPVTASRFLPGVAVVVAGIPAYLLGRDVLGSRPAGAAATAIVALNPQVLEWHVSAGGVVRALAFVSALTAVYAGYHVFTSGGGRAALVGAGAFGLTVLTHPTYSLFVVVTYLLFWGALDRSGRGLLHGAAVGIGGTAIAAPWLGWVLATHGPVVLAGAAGTHGGLGGGGLELLAGEFSPYVLVPAAAAAYLLAVRRAYLLPAWFVVAEVLFAQPRFSYTVGALALAAAGSDLAGRLGFLEDLPPRLDRRVLAAVVLVLGTLVGGAYLGHEMTLVADPSTPEFLDDEAIAAMEWAATETPEDATFVVLGDAAEWVPALAERTILVGPWGVEWRGPAAYEAQLDAFETVSACRSVTCVETTAGTVGGRPEYVYVPKGRYTVRGEGRVQFGTLERSFERSTRWERAFENDGVVIYRGVDG